MIRTTPTLSVFTPAYNRAHTIERTYKSLCRQTSKDFKWIIVDDGSTDNTRELVEPWLTADNGFVIEYYWKKNGGMHSAHNEAYRHIDTELAVCIDSDDWMPDNGVELIIAKWRRDGDERFAGIVGMDIFENGNIIGTKFPEGVFAIKTYDLKRKYGVVCDKKYIYRPEVIKKYLPYPEIEGERYGNVNFLYQVIDHDYDMLASNEVYCIVEYQIDGLTSSVFQQHRQSPKTRCYECNMYMKYLPDFKSRFKKAAQFVACSLFAHDYLYIKSAYSKFLVLLATPIGIVYALHLKTHKQRDISKDLEKYQYSKPLEK